MTPVDVYLMYCALKAHFGNKNYDYFKYEGKTRVPRDSFYKRKDRIFFTKLSKKYTKHEDIRDYLVSNFITEQEGYVAKFTDKNYEDWSIRQYDFCSTFIREMKPLVKNFEPLFEVKDNTHPKLLQEYLGKRVSLETLIILNSLLRYREDWDEKMSEDFIWADVKKVMKNYKGFLTIDAKRYRIGLLKLIEETS